MAGSSARRLPRWASMEEACAHADGAPGEDEVLGGKYLC
jgi:hypothetical protein